MNRLILFVAVAAGAIWLGLRNHTDPTVNPSKGPVYAAVIDASATYNSGLADVYDRLATRVERGEITTVLDAAKVASDESTPLYNAQVSAIEPVLIDQLGTTDLPSNAAAIFRQQASAHRSIAGAK